MFFLEERKKKSLVGRYISTLGADGFVNKGRIKKEGTPGSLGILREAGQQHPGWRNQMTCFSEGSLLVSFKYLALHRMVLGDPCERLFGLQGVVTHRLRTTVLAVLVLHLGCQQHRGAEERT